jgi:peptidoglycan-N-acetylglucosamine deacetylase
MPNAMPFRVAHFVRALTLLVLLLTAVLASSVPAAAEAQDAAPAPPKVLYLTFDDGPSEYTQPILDVLARHDAKATFFVVGRAARGREDFLRDIYASGHGIANHTYNHPSLPALGWVRFTAEVAGTGAVLGDLDHGCLRPPYGATSKSVRNFAGKLGYQIVMWTIDPRDWSRPGANAIAERVIRRAHPGGIVVLHDGGGDRTQTVAALEQILTRLEADGYTFAALCREGAPALPDKQPGLPPALPLADGGAAPETAAQLPPAPTPDNNGITSPAPDSTLAGMVSIYGTALHPAFRKWQLDLLLDGTEETFLALGEIPAPEASELMRWDTTAYPDGQHKLRLRVVRDALNYDEYFVAVKVEN